MDRDSAKFEEVHNAFRPKVRGYLTRLLGAEEAEDLTQEVFVRVYKGLTGFRGESSISTWVYRIATNVAMDRMRAASFHREAAEAASDEAGAEIASSSLGDYQPSAEQELERKQMNDCIKGVIDGLPPNYRTVIALSEITGLKNQEIAEVLGVSVDAVKVRLHRARTRLKRDLEARCTFHRDSRNEFACEPKPIPIKFTGRT